LAGGREGLAREDVWETYASGAFPLAGSEILKLLDNATDPTTHSLAGLRADDPGRSLF